MAKNNNQEIHADSVIGESVRVEGDLISDGDLQVEGTVNGKVKTSRNLHVGESARIQADINAQNATIAGVVEGNIEVEDTLVINDTGKVLGNIICQDLGVHEGAYFSGKVDMKRTEEDIAQLEEKIEEELEEKEEEE